MPQLIDRIPSFTTEAWLVRVADAIGPRLHGLGLDFRIRLDGRLEGRSWLGNEESFGDRLGAALDRSIRFVEVGGLKLDLRWLGEESGQVRLRVTIAAVDVELEAETREAVYGAIVRDLDGTIDAGLFESHLIAFRLELHEAPIETGADHRRPSLSDSI